MERGFVKLWRKLLDSGLLQHPTACQLFCYLLLKATHKPRKQFVGGAVFDLQPGDVIFGRVKVAAELNMTEKQARTALEVLKKLGVVAARGASKCTLVSLVNWHRYQQDSQCEGPTDGPVEGPGEGQIGANSGPTEGHKQEQENVRIKNNIYTASDPQQPQAAPPDGGAEHTPPTASRARQRERGKCPLDGEHILTRKGRYLIGKRLVAFNEFWEAFAYKRGKAEAADAWLDIPELTDGLVARICSAARQEAANRPQLEARGGTPKWAQGWLAARRWEDYAPEEPPPMNRARPDPIPAELTPEEREKAKEARRKLEADRRQREEKALAGQGVEICVEPRKPTTTNATLCTPCAEPGAPC